MKKRILVGLMAIVILFNLVIVGFADGIEPLPIKFKKSGGGQFIYCNNPEFIQPKDLSTVENPEATYLMKNEKLKPDKYSVFFCLYNSTGFDIEPDIEFSSKSDAVITINAIGYELPKAGDYWDCMSAWADYKNINIRTLNFNEQYVPYKGTTKLPVRIKLSEASEWINKYIYNYDVVKPNFTFNMLVDFTIESGEVDVNFAALKSYGIKGDRSLHNPNAAKGMYYRDTSVKGIDKETLPMVELDLNVKIDQTIKNGEGVPVKIFNQFFNEGNVAPHFVTNINPSRDMYLFSKGVAAGSDMLNLEYKDDSKLNYYGKNVAPELRDNVWKFDIYHHNTREYMKEMPWKEDDYIPNAFTSKTLDIKKLPNTEWEFNLGNFGVTTRFNLSIENKDVVPRALNYILDTSLSSNILILRDDKGNMLNPYTHQKSQPYALSKGINDEKKEECMFSTTLKPGETQKYILDLILPTNCYGGMLHSLVVDNYEYLKEKPATLMPNYNAMYPNNNLFFNGEGYMKWNGGELYTYNNEGYWEHMLMPGYAKKLFESKATDYRVVKTNSGYAVRFSAWDEFNPYIIHKQSQKKVYFFDDKFNLISYYEFPEYIDDMFYVNGTLYVKADKYYTSKNLKEFTTLTSATSFPASNGQYALIRKAEGLYINDAHGNNSKISYEDRLVPPEVRSAGEVFYYKKSWKTKYTDKLTKNIISVSADGLNWTDLELPDKFYQLLDVSYYGNKLYVDGRYETMTFDLNLPQDTIKVKLNGESLAFSVPPTTINGRTMVPLRFFFEKLGAKVTWVAETQEILVEQNNKKINLKIDSKIATVDSFVKEMDVPPTILNDKTVIPTRFLAESLGYDVLWDDETNTVDITVKDEAKIEKEQTQLLLKKNPNVKLMPYITDLILEKQIVVNLQAINLLSEGNTIKLKMGESEALYQYDLKNKQSVYTVDIDNTDAFKEICIVETGVNGNYKTTIYRIDDLKIYEYAKFEHTRLKPYYDEKGHIYFYNNSKFTSFDYATKTNLPI